MSETSVVKPGKLFPPETSQFKSPAKFIPVMSVIAGMKTSFGFFVSALLLQVIDPASKKLHNYRW